MFEKISKNRSEKRGSIVKFSEFSTQSYSSQFPFREFHQCITQVSHMQEIRTVFTAKQES